MEKSGSMMGQYISYLQILRRSMTHWGENYWTIF